MINNIIQNRSIPVKICGNCYYWSFNKISPHLRETRHYCNLAIKEGRFSDDECCRFPSEYCDNWRKRK